MIGEERFARWAPFPARYVRGGPELRAVRDRVVWRLLAGLDEVGGVATGPVKVSVIGGAVDPGRLAVLAEVRGLVLRNPNPFPVVSWWPAVGRLEELGGRVVEIPRPMLQSAWSWVRDAGRFWRLRER